MKSLSVRKFTVLGLFLTGASLLTAAFVPSKSAPVTPNGSVTAVPGQAGWKDCTLTDVANDTACFTSAVIATGASDAATSGI